MNKKSCGAWVTVTFENKAYFFSDPALGGDGETTWEKPIVSATNNFWVKVWHEKLNKTYFYADPKQGGNGMTTWYEPLTFCNHSELTSEKSNVLNTNNHAEEMLHTDTIKAKSPLRRTVKFVDQSEELDELINETKKSLNYTKTAVTYTVNGRLHGCAQRVCCFMDKLLVCVNIFNTLKSTYGHGIIQTYLLTLSKLIAAHVQIISKLLTQTASLQSLKNHLNRS
jgi:hypothetical protein